MPFAPNLPIETERLLLRPFTRGDVDAVFAYRQREDVARYLFDGPMSYESCAEAVQARIQQVSLAAENDRVTLAVARRDDAVLVGEITLIWRNVASQQGEVGYVFNPVFHGRGYAIEATRELVEAGYPTFGICLGHQIMALAAGAKTFKMKFGHHGANHPVKDLDTGRVSITSQNHGFAVDEKTLPANLRPTHVSLFDGTLQGLARTDKPAFCFQGHPEASPGPHDIGYLFDRFTALMEKHKAEAANA